MAITFVGSAIGSAINGASATINVGGIAGIANGDFIVVLSGGFNRTAGTGAVSTNGTGTFSESVNVLTGSQRGRLNSKVRNGDTTITLSGGSNAADALSGIAMVFRGASASFDVAAVSATGSSTNPNPPSIAPVNTGAFVVTGAASLVNDASPGVVTGFSTPVISNSGAETNAQTVSACYLAVSPGATDPAAFSTWSTGAWVSFSIALRPSMVAVDFAIASPTASITPAFNSGAAAAGLVANTLTVGSPVLPQAQFFQNGSGDDFYTKALLHMDGSEGSNLIVDVSVGGSVHNWTPTNISLTAGSKKFGPSSAFFNDSTNGFLSTPAHDDFAYTASEFTIDMWFRPNNGDGTYRTLISQNSVSGIYSGTIRLTDLNRMQAMCTIGGVDRIITGSTQFFASDTNFHHVALVRYNNNIRLYLDGIEEGTAISSSAPIDDNVQPIVIGRGGNIDNFYWRGYIDEVRVSKIARWTTNFTPPITAYGTIRAVSLGTQSPSIGSPLLNITRTLIASPLTVGSPVLGTPSISTKLNFVAIGKTVSSPTISTVPTFDTVTGPVATNFQTASPVIGTPALIVKFNLVATPLTVASPVLSTANFHEVHRVAASAFAASSPVLSSPALKQRHSLISTGLATGPPVLGPVSFITTALLANDLAVSALDVDEPDLLISSFATNLTVSSPVFGTPALTTRYTFVAVNLATAPIPMPHPSPLGQPVLAANDLVVGSPVISTPVYNRIYVFSQNQLVLVPYIATPAGNDLATSGLTANSLTVSSPVLGIPKLIGNIRAISIAVGSPNFGPAVLNQVQRTLAAVSIAVGSPVIGSPSYSRVYIFSQFPLGLLPVFSATNFQVYNSNSIANDLTVGSPVLVPPPLFTKYGMVSITGIVTGSPIVGTGTFGQRHTLSALDLVTGSPVIGAGVLGAGRSFIAIGLTTSQPAIGQPALNQKQVVAAVALTVGSPIFGAPAVVQNGNGVAVNLTVGSPVIGSAILNQKHGLNASSLVTSSPVIAVAPFAQPGSLAAVDLTTGSPVLSNGVMGAGYTFATDLLVIGSPVLGQPILGQRHSIIANSITVGLPFIGTPVLTKNSAGVAIPLSVGSPVIGSPAFSQKQILPAANALITTSPVIQIPNFTQKNILTAAGLATTSPAIDSGILNSGRSLIAVDLATGSPALGQPAMNQLQVMTAANLSVESPVFGTPSITQNANGVAVPLVVGLPEIGSPDLGQKHILAATSLMISSPAIATASFSQISSLATAGITTGSPVLGVPLFKQRHTLIGGLSVQSPVIGAPNFAQKHNMVGFILLGQPVIGQPIFTTDTIIKNLNAANVTVQSPFFGAAFAGEVGTIAIPTASLLLTTSSPTVKIKKVRHWRQTIGLSGTAETTAGLQGNVGRNENISGSVG